MFRYCQALIVKNRRLSDYEWMCQLDETKGIILGKTYTESVKSFIGFPVKSAPVKSAPKIKIKKE
jgi:hypothetical protein